MNYLVAVLLRPVVLRRGAITVQKSCDADFLTNIRQPRRVFSLFASTIAANLGQSGRYLRGRREGKVTRFTSLISSRNLNPTHFREAETWRNRLLRSR